MPYRYSKRLMKRVWLQPKPPKPMLSVEDRKNLNNLKRIAREKNDGM